MVIPGDGAEQGNEREKHACKKCGKEYLQKSSLKRHVKSAHRKEKHACSHCGKEYSRKDKLGAHVRDKHGERTEKVDPGIINSKKKLQEMYGKKKMSSNDIARVAGCSGETVRKKLERFGIDTRDYSESARERYGLEITEKTLREMYVEKKMSSMAIARELGCGKRTVLRRLEEHGITRRDFSESARVKFQDPEMKRKYLEAYKKREYRNYQNYSYPLSDQLKEFLTGSMLGDGHIKKGKLTSYYAITSKHKGYLETIVPLFNLSNYRVNYPQLRSHELRKGLLASTDNLALTRGMVL
ncbi:MAG: C2H2-type zinc finger protein [Candidatus Odinarchaeota archaeon]